MSQIAEVLMWRGINPPPPGSNRTTCPYCSPHRRKSHDRCLSVYVDPGWVEFVCHHCGWQDGEVIQ